MGLSFRMQQVAAMVEPCRTAADVGCDHGYVAMELVEKGIVRQMIAMDVRKGPLARAEENVRQRQLQARIACRLSDGLEALSPGEADSIIIAGLGGPLMIHILERGSNHRLGTEALILQPQSDIPAVRRYLHRIDYEIVKESMVFEDEKYYVIMKGKPQTDRLAWNAVEYQYGRDLLRQRSPILYQYLKKEYQQLAGLHTRLEGMETAKALQRLRELDQQLSWNQEAQNYYEAENNYTMA